MWSLLFCLLTVFGTDVYAQRLRVQMDPSPVHGTFVAGQTVTFQVRDLSPASTQARLPELVIERVVRCATTNRPFRAYNARDTEFTGCNSKGFVRDEQRVKDVQQSHTWSCEAKPMDAELAPVIYVELHTSRGVVVSQYRVDTGAVGLEAPIAHAVTWGNFWTRLTRHAKDNVAWYTIALTGLMAVLAVAVLTKFLDRVRVGRRRNRWEETRQLLGQRGRLETNDSFSWDVGVEESDDSQSFGGI